MLGWCELLMKKPGHLEKAHKYFRDSLEMPGGSRHIDSLVGLAHCQAGLRQWEEAMESVNQAVVQFPNNVVCLLEKMHILLAMQHWDQLQETCQRILSVDQYCIQAQATNILHIFCKEGKYVEVTNQMGILGH